MKILTDRQIRQKIRRLAIEIAEHNFEEEEIILAGINNAGTTFAHLLQDQLREISNLKIKLSRIMLNPADPLGSAIAIEMPIEDIKGKVIVIIDDVANTGRTIFYACKPLMETLPKKIEVAVLVDRTHKSFPIQVDYVGLSLATTLLENIDVQLKEVEAFGVFLN